MRVPTTEAALGWPFSDLALARRLERAEATTSARFVEARARVFPERAATWIEVAGAYVLFDGATSPLTQTFGLGLFAAPTPEDLTAVEVFFEARGAPACHEVSPLAGAAVAAVLRDRGYRPAEFTSVMYRPLGEQTASARPVGPVARLAGDADRDAWGGTAARGWSEFPGLGDFMADLGLVVFNAADSFPFLAEIDGRPAAAGVLAMHGGVALLAGASTVPEARGRGAQLALLDARLQFAAEHGSDLAMMGAQPGSASQRNAERHGFRIAYTRLKWELDRA